MRDNAATILYQAALALSRDAPNAAIARLTGHPKSTARAWINGKRRPPIPILEALATSLRAQASQSLGLAAELDYLTRLRKAEHKPRRGFFEVKVRDGQGSIPRDARWQGGLPKPF